MPEHDAPWTPGPWKISAPHGYARDVLSGDNSYIICGFGAAEYDDSTNNANARLIAAAPSLYEALTKLLRQCETGFSGWPATLGEVDARNDARSALAFARGETND